MNSRLSTKNRAPGPVVRLFCSFPVVANGIATLWLTGQALAAFKDSFDDVVHGKKPPLPPFLLWLLEYQPLVLALIALPLAAIVWLIWKSRDFALVLGLTITTSIFLLLFVKLVPRLVL